MKAIDALRELAAAREMDLADVIGELRRQVHEEVSANPKGELFEAAIVLFGAFYDPKKHKTS
jgi:predicted translin family RNA/ssDNA-binding protein